MKFFSGSSNKDLAIKVANELGINLSPSEIFVFPDGEKRIKLNEKVLDEDTIILQSTAQPTDSNYMELFFFIDALKRSGAKSVTVIIPYFGYSRQDHIFREGEDVSLEVIIRTLESLGMDRGISIDLHSIKTPEMFKVPFTHLSAINIFADKINYLKNDSKIVIVSPDMGGIRRVKQFAELLGNADIAAINKDRDLATGDITDSGIEGDVKDKIAFIVDDIASTGKTLVQAANLLLENGAIRVYAFITHAVLTEGALNILENSKIEKLFVTDSIKIPNDNQSSKIEILSVSKLIADALK